MGQVGHVRLDIVIYMPGTDYAIVADELIDAGLTPETPCAVVSHAGRPDQQTLWTNIGDLPDKLRCLRLPWLSSANVRRHYRTSSPT